MRARFSGANEPYIALLREGLNEIAGIGALDRARRRQHRDEAGARALRGRLDRRHRADEGHLRKGRAQIGADQRKRRVAGDDADLRLILRKQPGEQR